MVRFITATRVHAIVALLVGLLYLVATDSAAADLTSAPATQPVMKVAIIGLVHGHALGLFHRLDQHHEIELVGIAEADHSVAQRYARQFKLAPGLFYDDAEKMIAAVKPQAVLLYTNVADHRKMTELAASQGVAVMMEKPMAVSLADALAMQQAARVANVPVLVNYETSWYASNHAVYDLAQDGSIGEIRKIVAHDGHRGPIEIGVPREFSDWLTDPKLNGAGALYDFGCYGADLGSWLLHNQRPISVTAVTLQIKPNLYPHVDDDATIIVAYPKTQLIIQASWNWPYDRKDIEVYGTSGYAISVKGDHVRLMLHGKAEQTIQAKPLSSPMDDPLSMLKSVVVDHGQPDSLSSLETNVLGPFKGVGSL
jgi:predicted dehydrogenase